MFPGQLVGQAQSADYTADPGYKFGQCPVLVCAMDHFKITYLSIT